MSGDGEKKMKCAEFQQLLPNMFEGGDVPDHEHLRECDSCASLVSDLRYIADQAKLLLPLRDPNPRVWTNIESSLRKEPAPEGRSSTQAQDMSIEDRKKWKVIVTAAVISTGLLALLSALENRIETPKPAVAIAAGQSVR